MAGLAIKGGEPVRTDPFPPWPQFGPEEKTALDAVLESRQWGTLGPRVAEFEAAFSRYIGTAYCQTVCNGTVSLETILRALGIGPGDEVILPPYTFVATATAVLMVGAVPVFADVDPANNNMDPEAAAAVVTARTRALMPVHIAGIPADMDRLTELAQRHNLAIVEDAAQAHGSEWRNQKLGSLGTAGSFSFQLSKNMSAGEGGAVTTNDKALADAVWSIHHVGRRQDGLWYGHHRLASNYRMTDFQAAILLAQLGRLEKQIDLREQNAASLNREIEDIVGLSVFARDPRATRVTHHLYMFRFHTDAFGGVPKARFVDALVAEGIPAHVGYTPLQKQPVFGTAEVKRITGGVDYASTALPASDRACEQTVWIAQNALLGTEADMMDIVNAIRKIRTSYHELEP
jgi:dTDP-4-amino-4,6-dideoxygalactose transaminase